MEIITLQEYTDQYVSLYEGEIRNLPNDLALRLINKGVAVQHDKDILNSTTSDDNGKVLTVVNGKPAFVTNSGGSNSNSPSYTVFYAKTEEFKGSTSLDDDTGDFLYVDKDFTTYLTPSEAVEFFNETDFIIVKHVSMEYDQPITCNYFIIQCHTDNYYDTIVLEDNYGRLFYPYFEVEEDDTGVEK